jgi:galactokinase
MQLRAVSLFVPGRLEVFGKHTDYAGGRSLVAAVPRGISMSARRTSDGYVTVEDRTASETASFTGAGDGEEHGWRRYVRTVVRRLRSNFPEADLSARISLSSDLPQSAGISSSSAFVIAIAESLVHCAGIEALPQWQGAIRSKEERAAYFGCIENGADFGALAGGHGVGTHGGSEDHAAILMSEAGRLRAFSFAPIHPLQVVTMPAEWTFVVASSGVAAQKTGDVRCAYNRLAGDAAQLLAAWRREYPHDPRSLGHLAREGALSGFHPPAVLRSRFEHFIAEDARVAEATDAFARRDITVLGDLAAASHADADRLLGNQIEQTRALVDIAGALGAPAASSFGAGWGGSVWALVQKEDANSFARTWLTEYRRRHPDHASTAFVSPPSDGARRIG